MSELSIISRYEAMMTQELRYQDQHGTEHAPLLKSKQKKGFGLGRGPWP